MKTYLKPSISILGYESLGAKLQGTGSLFIACAGQPNCDYNLGADCFYNSPDYALNMYFFANNEDWMDTGLCSITLNGQAIDTDAICDVKKEQDCSYNLIGGPTIQGAVYHVYCSAGYSQLPCSASNTIEWSCEGIGEIGCSDLG